MAVIVKDLGIASAYGYAKSKGYTGTEEEFAELMASYADVAQQAEAAAQDAEDAKDAAITAKTAAQTAQTAAESAQTAAAGSAQTASTKATEASNSAQTAAGSATAAGNSATAAAGSATTAQTAAQTATTKASEASSSASAASTAKTGAETARTGAQTAQTAAETAQENAEAAAASVSASAAQIDQNTADIGQIKNDLNQFPNGNYPQMGAGYANQLVSGLKKADQTPYNFRRIPYDATLEEVKKIVGGTVVNNQLVDSASIPATKTESGVTFTNNTDGAITVNGTATADIIYVVVSQRMWDTHKYIISGCPQVGSLSTYNLAMKGAGTDCFDFGNGNIWDASGNAWKGIVIYVKSGVTVTNLVFKPNFTDLTLTFGTAIADYVYNLEQTTAGAGVAWLKTHFPKQFDAGYQAYDAGSLQSVSGLTAHKMVGFNQWNEEWEVGYINIETGLPVSANDRIRSKNFNPCLPNTTYYVKDPTSLNNIRLFFYDANKSFILVSVWIGNTTITTPSNARYFKFIMASTYGTTYNHDICINLSDSTKNGTYEPYEAHSYALDSDVVLRGVPKLNSNNQLYYDGDEYLPDGTVNRRYREIDFDGNEGWTLQSINSSGIANFALDLGANNKYTNGPHAVCNRFKAQITSISETTEEGFILSAPQYLYIRISSSKADTVTGFKTWLASNPTQLMFELATPTTETADPYQTPQIVSPDGTEEYVYTDGAFELPVGHSSEYPVNVSGQLDDILDTPSANGTYTLKATVTDGVVTYSWVADA